jgi:aspartate/methionine/tyrosine aminotransferase
MVEVVSSPRRDIQAYHPFIRLNRLLAEVPPGPSPAPDGQPIALQVGEPQNDPPAFLAEELTRAAGGWNRYPPPRGSEAYRRACADWLARRYPDGAGLVDPDRHILPLPGSREGLFFAALAAVRPGRECILLPNPFYHVYAGAAVAAGAEPVFVPATEATDFLPDYASLPAEILDRTALAYLNSPSNPQGAVASWAALARAIEVARRHDFAIALDECYAEIYDGTPPPGALEAAAELGGGLDNMLVFHSLSKRSSAPGLRCGFVAGDPRWLDDVDAALRVGGAGVALPVLAAGTRLWQEEAHVAANRARYRANFEVAEQALGPVLVADRPRAGFFLWLKVGDSEAAAVKLWREAGLRTLPGAYMSMADADGHNPGADYLRIALVYDAELTGTALRRIGEVLGTAGASPARA